MTRKPKKGDFRELKSKHLPGEHAPGPPRSLRLRRSLGNRSVFILDPRLLFRVVFTMLKVLYLRVVGWDVGSSVNEYNIYSLKSMAN